MGCVSVWKRPVNHHIVPYNSKMWWILPPVAASLFTWQRYFIEERKGGTYTPEHKLAVLNLHRSPPPLNLNEEEEPSCSRWCWAELEEGRGAPQQHNSVRNINVIFVKNAFHFPHHNSVSAWGKSASWVCTGSLFPRRWDIRVSPFPSVVSLTLAYAITCIELEDWSDLNKAMSYIEVWFVTLYVAVNSLSDCCVTWPPQIKKYTHRWR